MKVKMLTNGGCEGYSWSMNQIVDVPESVLQALGDGFERLEEEPVAKRPSATAKRAVKTSEMIAPKNVMMTRSRTKKVK